VARRIRGGGFFVSGVELRGCALLWEVSDVFLKRVARKMLGEHNSNLGKLRLAMCTVCCVYGSIDHGELSSVGKRWTVRAVQRAM
jgi:hypothetical protein